MPLFGDRCSASPPPDNPTAIAFRDYRGELGDVQEKTDWGVLDCLGEIAGLGDYQHKETMSSMMTFPFGEFRILSVQALIAAKEAMARAHDLRTALMLRAIADKQQHGG